jgi:hypothetical protein
MNVPTETTRSKIYKVIIPVEHRDGSKHWLRIGSAYPNKDASINLYLDALPAGAHNVLQIRELTEEDFNRRKPGFGEHGPLPPPPPLGGNGRTEDLPF